jgi:hypothetical protein
MDDIKTKVISDLLIFFRADFVARVPTGVKLLQGHGSIGSGIQFLFKDLGVSSGHE